MDCRNAESAMGTLSGGQLRVTMDGSGHLLPCLGACPSILHNSKKCLYKVSQRSFDQPT